MCDFIAAAKSAASWFTSALIGRGFDQARALDVATQLFWKHGFEGTSLAELTEAVGINPPSLHACFVSKEGPFRAALDHYGAGTVGYFMAALEAPTLRQAAELPLFGGAWAVHWAAR